MLEDLYILTKQQYIKYNVNLCYLFFSLDERKDFTLSSIDKLSEVLSSIEVKLNNLELEALAEVITN